MSAYLKLDSKKHQLSDPELAAELARDGIFIKVMSFGGKYPADVYEMHPSAHLQADMFTRVAQALLSEN